MQTERLGHKNIGTLRHRVECTLAWFGLVKILVHLAQDTEKGKMYPLISDVF